MRARWVAAVVTASLFGASGSAAAAAERFEDPLGDATGDSPDVTAVVVSERENSPSFSIGVELAEGREFGTDGETWSDVVFLLMSADSDLDERDILTAEFHTGVHGVTLPMMLSAGAMLDTPDGLYEHVVDVEQDGQLLTFTLDRKLLGSPPDLYLQVLLGVERFDAEVGADAEGDFVPDEGQPPLHVELGRPPY